MLKLLLIIILIAHARVKSEEDLKFMKNHLKALTSQVMLQQFFSEQRVRSEGQSGIKLIRQRRSGTKNYFTESHSGFSAAAIHDHANNIRTVGMGEFTAVLNGVEFRTRHNDYRLFMPSRTSNKYHAVEPVPFPDVPPEVVNKSTVDEQIVEMQNWFKAWRDEDHSKRDYRKYFKPVLCYLEGAWTQKQDKIDEPFNSDRHFIDASSWMELHKKVRYVAQSGGKSINENLSFLPTKIMSLINDTIPNFAQWNYRILCHPVKKQITRDRLRVVEDLSSRMMTNFDIFRHINSRAARFQFNARDLKTFFDKHTRAQLLDEIMAEIPGKNNYNSFLKDGGLDGAALNLDKSPMDASKYHRWFRVDGRDAMGTSNQHRGYSDDNMFVALTTHPQVAPVDLKKCTKAKPKNCWNMRQRWSYAVPLELIFLTPLSKWNPYNLKYHGDQNKNNLAIVRRNGRTGECKQDKAFNGTTSRVYYLTPSKFFSQATSNKDAADTARGVTCVLDKNDVMRYARASGTHVFLPKIPNVGVMRQRYPIYPVHGEGSAVWKELNALREITMNEDKWKHMFWTATDAERSSVQPITLNMAYSLSTVTSRHTHQVELSTEENIEVKKGQSITKTTTQINGHTHDVIIYYYGGNYFYRKCDGKSLCWDKHRKLLSMDDE